MGYDVVLMETVGAGQDQTNVALIVDTTIVVVAPGLGDRLQAIKSGILEVGDILVVNKGDRLGADGTAADLLNAVMMGERKGWHPPVIKTVALESKGIEELMAEIARHAAHSAAEGSAKARKHRAAENEIVEAIKTRLFERFFNGEDPIGKSMSEYAARLCERKSDPLILADAILREKDIS
jgi:LAO/AO transport system kinase